MKLQSWIFGAAFAAGCAVDRPQVPDPEPVAVHWTLDHATSDGTLLGVWGSSANDVWAVGGQADRALVMHGDGARWTRVDIDAPSLLWSVYGFSATDVYAVGEGGLILRYDGIEWRRVESGTDLWLYGVWGSSKDDVWIVGGDRNGPPGSAVMLRGSGDSFRVVAELPAELVPRIFYKVHGLAPDDVRALGSDGMLRYDGVTWRRDPLPTSEPLFAMWGHDEGGLYAVGGSGTGEVLHWDGERWSEVAALPIGTGLSGVFSSADGPTIMVGAYAYVFELGRDGVPTTVELPAMGSRPFFHGVWGDGEGTTYVVGGDLFDYPRTMTGTIVRRAVE
jgi:hypothetical protein